MKVFSTIATALVVTGIVAAAARLMIPRQFGIGSPPHVEEAEQNPQAREQWEWMRLRDPATGTIPDGIGRKEMAFAATIPSRDQRLIARRDPALALPDYTWLERGPANVGGRTRAMALDADNPGIILAGGASGGMWRSGDGGTSWARTTTPAQHPTVTCIAQDTRPGRRNIWYYGTGEGRTNSNRFGNTALLGDGIFRSADSGRSWSQLPSTITGTPQTLDGPFDIVWNIVVDTIQKEKDILYAATHGAIMRSSDGGGSWKAVLGSASSGPLYTTVAMGTDGSLYAGFGAGGSPRGIWRSSNGIDWADITPNGWADSCRRIVIDIPKRAPHTVYVLAETPENGLIVAGLYGVPEYYSFLQYSYLGGNGTGSGGSWDDRSLNLPHFGGAWDFNGLASYALTLRTDPRDPDVVFVGGSCLFRSPDAFRTDAGTIWLGGYHQDFSSGEFGMLHPDIHDVLFSPAHPDRLYVACDGGIFRADDATNAAPTWVPLNNNYLTSQFYTVALDPGTPGSRTLLAGAQDNGTWTTSTDNAAEPWSTPFGGDGGFCAIAPGGNIWFMSPQNGPIYMLTINSDSTPGEYMRVDPPIEDQVLFVNPFALDPANPNILYDAGGHTIWQCLDIAGIDNQSQDPTDRNWTNLTETRTDSTITALGVSRSNPGNRLYYGTSDGRVYRLDEALSAHNPPQDITSGAFPDGAYINCIAVDPEDGNSAIVVFTNYNVKSLFLTTDAGEHWTPIGGNLEQFEDGTGNGPSCRWATMVHRRNGIVYFVATTTGLYSTTRLAGNSTLWSLEGASAIGNVRVDMIQARESDGTVAVATWGHGIFTTQLPDMVAGVTGPARPALRLEQNFPNPFTTATEIRFEIPEDGISDAVLEVIDPLGRIVALPFTRGILSGEGSIRLDLSAIPPSRMPSGVYSYRLRCGERSVTRRMVVMR